MRFRNLLRLQSFPPIGLARAELLHQVPPLVVELAARHRELNARPRAGDLPHGEAIAAGLRFAMHGTQIFGDGADRRRLLSETKQLRMVLVSLGLSAKHGLREERLAPQSDEPACVEIFWVQAPEAQRRYPRAWPGVPRSPKRTAARSRAFAASTSRSRGADEETRESRRARATSEVRCTARSNAASFAFDGFVKPLIL